MRSSTVGLGMVPGDLLWSTTADGNSISRHANILSGGFTADSKRPRRCCFAAPIQDHNSAKSRCERAVECYCLSKTSVSFPAPFLTFVITLPSAETVDV